MASQLSIELTLENAAGCLFTQGYLGTIAVPVPVVPSIAPTYSVGNVNLIPEIMEFDSSVRFLF